VAEVARFLVTLPAAAVAALEEKGINVPLRIAQRLGPMGSGAEDDAARTPIVEHEHDAVVHYFADAGDAPAPVVVDGMQRFDVNRACPKCGGTKSKVEHRPAVGGHKPERLERRCETCGFKWDEAPLDAAAAREA